ncbi:hypothetical protein OAH04_01700 [Crocinitomicaceae bacterium]|nr:hypothetical protein [Crocinitomicaceae bacterium]
MKVLSIVIVLFVFQSNAQINLLNDPNDETIVPTSVEYSSRNPQIISNMLLVGESNKLLVAYDPLDTQASSPFNVIGGEVDGEFFEGSTLPEDILKWMGSGERVSLTLFYQNKESSEIDIVSDDYNVTCYHTFRPKQVVEKGYKVFRNKGKSKVLFDVSNPESFVSQYQKNMLNSELSYKNMDWSLLKKIQSENTSYIWFEGLRPDGNSYIKSTLDCSKENQSFDVWYDSILALGLNSPIDQDDFSEIYPREEIFKFWSEARNNEEKSLKYETDLWNLYLNCKHRYTHLYPLVHGYDYSVASCLDRVISDYTENMVATTSTYSDSENFLMDVLYREHQTFDVWYDSISKIAKKIIEEPGMLVDFSAKSTYQILKGKFKKASLKGDGTALESIEKDTYATLNETDVIILTYRKLGDEVRYDDVYFAKKTEEAKKPIVTAHFPYLKSFELDQNTSFESSWPTLVRDDASGIWLSDNTKGRKKLNSLIMTPETFEEFGIDLDQWDNYDYMRFY